jgi:hypothetical protein
MSIPSLLVLGAAVMAAAFPPPDRLPAHPDFPDPLTTFAGEKVTSRDEWEAKRRPELKARFQHYMYGRLPDAPKGVEGVVLHEDRQAFGGKATLREVELRFDAFGKSNPLPIRLLLSVPNGRAGKVPVFVGMNFSGNHALTDDPKVRLPDVWMYPNRAGVKANRATDAGRGTAKDVWPLELAASRGYAVATFYNGDIQPDRPNVPDDTRIIGITRKHLSAAPHFVELGHDFPADLSPEEEAIVSATVQKALDAVGFDFGPAHTELRLAERGPTIIEINPRLAGGMIPELIRLATGVDLVADLLDRLVGAASPASLRPTRSEHASIRFVVATKSGRLRDVLGCDRARRIDGVRMVSVERALGSEVRPPTCATDRLGFVIASGPDAARTRSAADEALGAIRLLIEE